MKAPGGHGHLVGASSRGENLKTVREIIPPFHVMQEKLGRAPLPSSPTRPSAKAPSKPGAPVAALAPEQGASEALAIQEAINSMWAPAGEASIEIEVPPSGVRLSEPSFPNAAHAHAAHAAHAARAARAAHAPPAAQAIYTPEARVTAIVTPAADGVPDSLLSFKVYTLADLERRSDAPVSMRMSRASFDLTGSGSRSARALIWPRTYAALRAFIVASLEWFRTKGERPSPKVALRKPFDALGDELQVAVESVDWRTLGVRMGIVVGATLTLLFAVLTAAELTDDLKPAGATSRLASSESTSLPPAKNALGAPTLPASTVAPATNMAAGGMQMQPAPQPMQVVTAGEIDDPAPAAPAKKAAKKPAPKKSNKLSFRNADAVFQK